MFKAATKRQRGKLTRYYSSAEAAFTPRSIADCSLWLDRNGTGSTWQDSGPNGWNGTLANGAAWSNGVVTLDGTNDEVNGFSTSISPSSNGNSRSCAVWATNTNASPGRRGLIGTRPAAALTGWFFGTFSNTSIWYNITGVSSMTISPVSMPATGVRACWGFTKSGTLVTIYLNGFPVGIGTVSGTEASSSFNGLIGGEQDASGGEHWQGSIDRVAMYTRALTPQEMYSLYANLS